MRDQYDDRIHQALRHDFAANVGAIMKSIAYAFDRLQARLYAAPWDKATGKADQPCPRRMTTTF